ncbi:MAG: NAD+ synthase [Bacteroidota bacterium]
MKIALVQASFIEGAFGKNLTTIITHIRKAKDLGVDIVVFPELAISGGNVGDIADYDDFGESNLNAINAIASECRDIAVVVGCYIPTENTVLRPFFNAACFIAEGKMQQIVAKTVLNDSDISEESRYFEPNTDFLTCTYKNETFAIVISDDISVPVVSMEFSVNPMDQISKQSPTFAICIGAVPFDYNQREIRHTVISTNAARYEIPFLFVNMVGGHNNIVYDGGSLVANAQGEITYEMNYFKEDVYVVNLNNKQENISEFEIPNLPKIARIYDAITCGLRDYFARSGFKKAVIGLSGGIDSAVTAALMVDVLGKENVMGVLLPSEFSTSHSIKDAEDLAKNLGIEYDIVPIKTAYNTFMQMFEPRWQDLPFDVTEENLQARIRAVVLMSYSNKFKAMLVNTSNKSEAAVGYGTLYGDLCGGISALGDLYKTQVYELTHYLNRNGIRIPENTITKAPSAELRPGQKDADSLPDYDILDKLLYAHLEGKNNAEQLLAMGFDQALVNKVLKLIRLNEYKRCQAPPIIRVSTCAFGHGRRFPVVW